MKTITRTLVLFAFVLTSFAATAQKKPTTAIELNDYLVSFTDSLYKKGNEWGTKFSQLRKTKNFSALTPFRKSLEDFIDRKRLELISLKDIGGSQNLRLAMVDFLAYEKSLILDGFIAIEKLNSTSTEEEINALVQKLTVLSKDEAEKLKKVHEAQEEYAKKNGFTIESEEEDQ